MLTAESPALNDITKHTTASFFTTSEQEQLHSVGSVVSQEARWLEWEHLSYSLRLSICRRSLQDMGVCWLEYKQPCFVLRMGLIARQNSQEHMDFSDPDWSLRWSRVLQWAG